LLVVLFVTVPVIESARANPENAAATTATTTARRREKRREVTLKVYVKQAIPNDMSE
jgi:hypothetical protein